MSVRARRGAVDNQVARLRAELDALKSQAQVADADISASVTPGVELDALSPVEQSVVALGVKPNGYRPIGSVHSAFLCEVALLNSLCLSRPGS